MSGSFNLQLSMEWYLYVAVSGIALLSSIGMLASKYPIMRNEVHSYEISEFVDEVNTAIYSGNLYIRAYIPDGRRLAYFRIFRIFILSRYTT